MQNTNRLSLFPTNSQKQTQYRETLAPTKNSYPISDVIHPVSLSCSKQLTSHLAINKTMQKDYINNIMHFINQNQYEFPLTKENFYSASSATFTDTFKFLIRILCGIEILSSKQITDEFVINFMKQMGYPHTLKRQLFIAMTAPHNWPQFLSILSHLIDIIRYQQQAQDEEEEDSNLQKQISYDQKIQNCIRDIILEQNPGNKVQLIQDEIINLIDENSKVIQESQEEMKITQQTTQQIIQNQLGKKNLTVLDLDVLDNQITKTKDNYNKILDNILIQESQLQNLNIEIDKKKVLLLCDQLQFGKSKIFNKSQICIKNVVKYFSYLQRFVFALLRYNQFLMQKDKQLISNSLDELKELYDKNNQVVKSQILSQHEVMNMERTFQKNDQYKSELNEQKKQITQTKENIQFQIKDLKRECDTMVFEFNKHLNSIGSLRKDFPLSNISIKQLNWEILQSDNFFDNQNLKSLVSMIISSKYDKSIFKENDLNSQNYLNDLRNNKAKQENDIQQLKNILQEHTQQKQNLQKNYENQEQIIFQRIQTKNEDIKDQVNQKEMMENKLKVAKLKQTETLKQLDEQLIEFEIQKQKYIQMQREFEEAKIQINQEKKKLLSAAIERKSFIMDELIVAQNSIQSLIDLIQDQQI